MKLRNKQTGEIEKAYITMDGDRIAVIVADMPLCGNSVLGEYGSLAELNEGWEAYKPTEPLIKDEKVRKAVRAWAEANDIDKVCVQNNYCLSSEEDEEVEIVFASPVFKEYVDSDDFIAIAELCGEEEE